MANPDRCVFHHPAFIWLGDVAFRPGRPDGVPSMIMMLGATIAAVPLDALQAELDIDAASHDGRLIAMIGRALDFVGELRPGDPLPAEIRYGGASWQPDPVHAHLARSRLHLQLTNPDGDWHLAPIAAVLVAAAATGLLRRVRAALTPGQGAVLEDAVQAMAFIESLRDRLLDRAAAIQARVSLLVQTVPHAAVAELVGRVRHLTTLAVAVLHARCADAARYGTDVPALLAAIEPATAQIAAHRDWLFCTLRAWEPLLQDWDAAGPGWHDGTTPLLAQSYRFLALRYMPRQEWLAQCRAPDSRARTMVW